MIVRINGQSQMLDAVIVGEVIRRFRKKIKKTQECVSELSGIKRSHLSAIERGVRKPTMETFFKIADAINVKPSIIMAAIEEELEKD